MRKDTAPKWSNDRSTIALTFTPIEKIQSNDVTQHLNNEHYQAITNREEDLDIWRATKAPPVIRCNPIIWNSYHSHLYYFGLLEIIASWSSLSSSWKFIIFMMLFFYLYLLIFFKSFFTLRSCRKRSLMAFSACYYPFKEFSNSYLSLILWLITFFLALNSELICLSLCLFDRAILNYYWINYSLNWFILSFWSVYFV